MCDKKAYKLFKLQTSSINVLTLMNDIIVIGDSDGHVRFIDQHLHILMWYKHFKLGPINSLSFAQTTKDYTGHLSYPLEPIENDATIQYNKFLCKDFLVNTKNSCIAYVTKSGTGIKIISQSTDSQVHGLACHPTLPRVCYGDYNGVLQLWDYEHKRMICARQFSKGYANSAFFSHYQPENNLFDRLITHLIYVHQKGKTSVIKKILESIFKRKTLKAKAWKFVSLRDLKKCYKNFKICINI